MPPGAVAGPTVAGRADELARSQERG